MRPRTGIVFSPCSHTPILPTAPDAGSGGEARCREGRA